MKHIAVCNIELNHMSMGLFRVLKDTMNIYRAVCKFLGEVVETEWDSLSNCKDKKDMLSCVERLIHQTKQNPSPKYPEFDRKFYKLPQSCN